MKKFGLLLSFFIFFTSTQFAQIISQYVETNSGTTPKGIEVWNNTASALDFATNNLEVQQGTNGAVLSTIYTIDTGTLAVGAVLVIGTSDMEATANGNGAAFYLKAFTFNGDDALALVFGGTTTDVFGIPGVDPGSAWTGNGVSTANQNIQLQSGITKGNLDGWTDPSLRFEVVSTDPVNNLTGFGLAPGLTSPSLVSSPTSLSGFTYVIGTGPSTSQSYDLSGTNLTGAPGNITVTGSTNYEVSTDNSSFSSSVNVAYASATLSSTPIYVRLKSGLSAGDYNSETISNAGGSATTQNVTCNGSVTPSSVISVDPTTLTGFTFEFGSGPSTSQNYSLSGTNLTPASGNLTVTGSTNYEVSTDNSSFSGSVDVPYSGGALSSTSIYVRLKSDLTVGSYNSETIANSGGGAITADVTCNGSVTAPIATLPLVENFEFSTGDLTSVSSAKWVNFSGTGNFIQVTSGSLSYNDYPTSGIGNKIEIISASTSAEDVYSQFTTQSEGTKVYTSFLINLQNTSGLSDDTSSAGDYFVTFLSSTSIRTFDSRVSIKLGTTADTYQIGLRASSGNTEAVWSTKDFDINTTYLIVISYEMISGTSNDVASLWINPPLTGLEPSADLTQTAATEITDVSRIAIRQGGSTPNASIDGIRVATDWSLAPLPVELTSFTAQTNSNAVELKWNTATELNNYGFEIQRKIEQNESWTKIGFVRGNGNSNSPKNYNFADPNVTSGKYYYRLKQIDNDGKFEYSKIVEVNLSNPDAYELNQNYPNPFNPVTTINYEIPKSSKVKLVIFDMLGREVKTLVNEYKESGRYDVQFDASKLASGTYLYKIQAGSFVEVKKMILMK